MRIVPPMQLPPSGSKREPNAPSKRPSSWSLGRLAGQILGCLPRARPGAPAALLPMPPLPQSEAAPASLQATGGVPAGGSRQTSAAHLAASQAALSAVLNVDFFALLSQTHPAGISDTAELTAQVRARLASAQATAAGSSPHLLLASRLDRLLPVLVKVVAAAYRHHMHDLTLLQRQRARVELLLPLHLEGYIGRFARPLARQLARMVDA